MVSDIGTACSTIEEMRESNQALITFRPHIG